MSTRVFRAASGFGLTFVLVALAPNASSQIYGAGETVPGAVDESASIDLDVNGRPIEDVLKLIRDKSGANILLAPGVEAKVTLTFRGVPWREALDLVSENAGCVVVETRGRVFKVEKPTTVNYSFNDEDIRKVIQAISQQAGANVVIAPDVQGLVTLDLKDRPWRDALDNVVKTLGYHVVEEERGILRIVTTASLVEQLETRVVQMRYLRPRAPYTATIKTDFAVGGPVKNVAQQSQDIQKEFDKTFPLLDALRKQLSKNGQLDYFDKQNAIFIKDTKPVIDRIAEIVERLDIEPAQIFIDVKFVTTSEGDNLDLAMGAEQVTATFNGAAISSKVPFNLGPGGFDDHIFPIDDGDPLGGPTVANADATALLTGLLDFRNVRLAVRLNQDVNHAEVVQAPKLITLDHQDATVFVGDIIRYAEAQAATNQAGGLQFTLKEAENSPVETGFQLLVIPHCVPGTSKVLMTVIPQARFLSGTTDPDLQGFNRFGDDGVATISLPQVTSQTVVTNMMLESGQTGVIGGLITDREAKLVHKVPILGDIPIIGFFFRRTQDAETHNHLLVFLTPTIIRGAQVGEDNLSKMLQNDSNSQDAEWRRLMGAAGGGSGGAGADGEKPAEPAPAPATNAPPADGNTTGASGAPATTPIAHSTATGNPVGMGTAPSAPNGTSPAVSPVPPVPQAPPVPEEKPAEGALPFGWLFPDAPQMSGGDPAATPAPSEKPKGSNG